MLGLISSLVSGQELPPVQQPVQGEAAKNPQLHCPEPTFEFKDAWGQVNTSITLLLLKIKENYRLKFHRFSPAAAVLLLKITTKL